MKRIRILVINGPNLNLLGTREPETYGRETLADVEARLCKVAVELETIVECHQTNHEGQIIDLIQKGRDRFSGLIINPGGYTHTSVAIRDAIAGTGIPTLEVHISNIHAREEFRHHSLIAPVCIGQIAGLGTDGYEWALRALTARLRRT
jgi:3-dehydroquinate dehydratase-2